MSEPCGAFADLGLVTVAEQKGEGEEEYQRMSGRVGGGGGKGSNGISGIPSASRKMVQSLKEIVNNYADHEIYAMLKECNMDPNEAVSRLLSQGSLNDSYFSQYFLYLSILPRFLPMPFLLSSRLLFSCLVLIFTTKSMFFCFCNFFFGIWITSNVVTKNLSRTLRICCVRATW